jgi:2-polyprenyl-6-methoxyphenol hydroxylase-like FAD-dependent oxidoreductase
MADVRRSFVVVGGSIAGMGTALALARSGAAVSLVERDVIPEASGPEEAFALERPGVPQSHFLHAFLARMVHVMRERFPDVLDRLVDAGAHLSHPPVPGLEDITMLLARRSTVEWVMRRAVLAEPRITCVAGRTVVALEGADRHVAGARLDDGTVLEGSVVACTGRRTDLAAWVAPFGVTIEEELVQSELIYITRWYRASELAIESSGILKDLGFLSYLVVPGDGDSLAVAVGIPPDDRELRASMLEDDGFDRVASRLPGLEEVLAQPTTRPLRSSQPMAGLVNRIRRFTDAAGDPVVTGFYAVGDAHTCTNPAYGRGCSLALVGATLLADAVAAHPDDPTAQARAYEAACAREIEPWYHSSVMMDQARQAMRSGSSGQNEAPSGGQPDVLAVLVAASAGLIDDLVVIGGFARLLHLLVTPQELFSDPEFTSKLFQLMSNPPEIPAGHHGPTREELLQAASAAA